jgi:hypothetical protein
MAITFGKTVRGDGFKHTSTTEVRKDGARIGEIRGVRWVDGNMAYRYIPDADRAAPTWSYWDDFHELRKRLHDTEG